MSAPKEVRDAARDVLASAIENKREADRALVLTIRHCRSLGLSWGDIGQAFGVSRQAAWERFSTLVRDMPCEHCRNDPPTGHRCPRCGREG